MKTRIVSDCCGAEPKVFNGDCDSTDFGLCPSCGDHCEFIDEPIEEAKVIPFGIAMLRAKRNYKYDPDADLPF